MYVLGPLWGIMEIHVNKGYEHSHAPFHHIRMKLVPNGAPILVPSTHKPLSMNRREATKGQLDIFTSPFYILLPGDVHSMKRNRDSGAVYEWVIHNHIRSSCTTFKSSET